jgi:uncharacterized membrane protein
MKSSLFGLSMLALASITSILVGLTNPTNRVEPIGLGLSFALFTLVKVRHHLRRSGV